MKLAFLVNDVAAEKEHFSTVLMALEATRLGHEVWFLGAGDFAYDDAGELHARAAGVRGKRHKSTAAYLEALAEHDARRERVAIGELDVLFLRNDPSDARAWAQTAGIVFGRLAASRGVIVVNDPGGLAAAMNKTYFQSFPEEVRPKTLITRDPGEIREFVARLDGGCVLKPLQGSGGHNVFLVRGPESANLNQMIETVMSEGYVIAQEYLPEIEKGDVRLVLLNGRPFEVDGKYAAFRRVGAQGDVRSNVSAGGSVERAEVDAAMLRIADIVRPRLVEDGMFLVGLDVVGDKLMEVNVFSPGGLLPAEQLEGVRFAREVIRALERKVAYARYYRRHFRNAEMATM